MTTWQPIATAPLDGRVVVLRFDTPGVLFETQVSLLAHFDEGWVVAGKSASRVVGPSAWRPLTLAEIEGKPNPTPRGPMTWKPIDTAPHNGTPVIVRGHNEGDPAKGYHAFYACYESGADGDGWFEVDGMVRQPLGYLTEWLDETGTGEPNFTPEELSALHVWETQSEPDEPSVEERIREAVLAEREACCEWVRQKDFPGGHDYAGALWCARKQAGRPKLKQVIAEALRPQSPHLAKTDAFLAVKATAEWLEGYTTANEVGDYWVGDVIKALRDEAHGH